MKIVSILMYIASSPVRVSATPSLMELKSTPRSFPTTKPFYCLDYQCGVGHTTDMLQKKYPECSIIGYDRNQDHITMARMLYPHRIRFISKPDDLIQYQYHVIQILNSPRESLPISFLWKLLHQHGHLWLHEDIVYKQHSSSDLYRWFEFYQKQGSLYTFLPQYDPSLTNP